jgi:chemotaxis protein histidine kinase CheA
VSIPKDILDEFCQESQDLIGEMVEILEEMEEQVSSKGFEKFGQLIDRIMGAARSIGLDDLGLLCEYGKTIGYKASQAKNPKLLEVTRDILFDATDMLEDYFVALMKHSGEEKFLPSLDKMNSRMNWLSKKFSNITRSSVAIAEEKNQANDLDDDFDFDDDDFDFDETPQTKHKKAG